MTEIDTVGLCKDARDIVDALEEIEQDLKGMSGSLSHNASTQRRVIRSIFSIGEEIGWLAGDVADICRNGATYMKSYQTMGQFDYKFDCLYDIRDSLESEYWRVEIEDNIRKLSGLYAPMLRVMENAVIKHARAD